MPFEDEIQPGGNYAPLPPHFYELTRLVIGAAIEVHRRLGPGLPEAIYQRAMELELTACKIPFEREKYVNIYYRDVLIGTVKIDFLIAACLVVEFKAVDVLIPIHRLQARTYMRILKQPLALLINFNVPLLKHGIQRVIETEDLSQ